MVKKGGKLTNVSLGTKHFEAWRECVFFTKHQNSDRVFLQNIKIVISLLDYWSLELIERKCH